MGKPKAPQPTDPRETSSAATGTNVSTAIANNMMGNINEYGPDGSTVVNQSGDYTWTDPYTKETYTVPKFTRTTTLSDMQQNIKNAGDGAELNLANLAKDQSGFLGGYMAKPFKYNAGQHEKWATGLYDKLNSGKIERDNEAMRSQLANSGVKLGSDAYSRASQDQQSVQQTARDQFGLDSYQTGFSSAQATRNQPINEITALMAGSQVSQPQFMGANIGRIPTTDNAGIISNYDNQRMNAWQQEQAQRQAMMGGLFSLGSSMIGLSDRTAKKNIKRVGEITVTREDGSTAKTGSYEYNYRGEKPGTPKHTGVMAQNLERIKPSAVMTLGSGLKAVDYAQI